MDSQKAKQQSSAPVLYFDNMSAWSAQPPLARMVAEPVAPAFPPTQKPTKKPRTLRPYPTRAMLGILLLLGTCAAVVCWNAKPGPSGAAEQLGFDLRSKAPAPKVNITSAEAAKLPAPPMKSDKSRVLPSAEVVIPKPPTEVVQLTPPPPPMTELRVPPVEEPGLLMPVVFQNAGSLACSCFCDLHRGDTPMMRNWNVVKMSSLMAAALALTPAPVSAQAVTAKDMKDLKEAVDNLAKKVEENNMKVVYALDGINSDLTKIKNDVNALNEASKNTAINVAAMQEQIKTLDDKVKALAAEVEKLKGKGDVRLYPAEKAAMDDLKARLDKIDATLARMADGRISNAPPANMGRILLANMYPEPMLFVINGQNYRVAPYATMPLENQPPGVFSYEVISGTYGSVRTNRPTLEPGKTYTITVR